MSHQAPHLSAHVRHPHGSSAVAPDQRIDVKSASDADIAKRAYEKYEARGCTHGFDVEDWTAASHELIAETFGHLSLNPSQNASQRSEGTR